MSNKQTIENRIIIEHLKKLNLVDIRIMLEGNPIFNEDMKILSELQKILGEKELIKMKCQAQDYFNKQCKNEGKSITHSIHKLFYIHLLVCPKHQKLLQKKILGER